MNNPWTEHLKKVKSKNPNKSLKECMQLAKLSYRGGGSNVNKNQNKKSTKNDSADTKNIIKDIVGLSKDLMQVTSELNKPEVKKLSDIADMIQKIHENHNRQDSEEGSGSECSESGSDSLSSDSDSD